MTTRREKSKPQRPQINKQLEPSAEPPKPEDSGKQIKRKEIDYGSLHYVSIDWHSVHYLSALLPHAEGQALAEGERNALTQLFIHLPIYLF